MTNLTNSVMHLTKKNILKSNMIRQDVISEHVKYKPVLAQSMQYILDVPEISVVVKGSGVHTIFNQAVPCRAGDMYIIAPGIPHAYFQEEEPLEVRRMFFDPKDWFAGELVREGDANYCYGVFYENAVASCAMLTSDVKKQVLTIFDDIESELSGKNHQWQAAVDAKLSLLLIYFGRYVKRAVKNLPNIPKKDVGIISVALQSVEQNYFDNAFTLESLAEALHVSASNLSRLFKRVTGQTFSDYLRVARLNHACMLLTETALSIEEIVEACGLKDVPAFYHVFHSYMGTTPNKYRLNNKKIEDKGEKIMVLMSEISENLQKGKAKIVKELVQTAIDEGSSVEQILREGLIDGMNVVGEKFRNNEIFVPEVLVAARAMSQGAALLKPLLQQAGIKAAGKVCIGTVQGDLHDIGKNLVKMMLEGKGFEVVDLGTDVSPEAFVDAVINQSCQIICCSALLTTTMGVMENVIKALEEAGVRHKVKVMVGGAPVSCEFAKQIGADAYTSDAAEAAQVALTLINQ